MLRSLIFEIDGNKSLIKNNFLGYELYSAVLNLIRNFYKDKSQKYHQKNIKKPFTTVPPFLIKQRIFFRLNFLNDEIFSLFFSAIFNQKEIIIKEKFSLEKIYLKKDIDLPKILNNQLFYYDKNKKKSKMKKKFLIKTITPFFFKKGEKYVLFPTEEIIKNSFYNHQKQIYSKIIYHLPDFKIEEINLETKKIFLNPFKNYISSFGSFKITADSEKDIQALSFFGIGSKTAMGMGQIKIIDISGL